MPVWTKVMRQPVDGQHVVTQQRRYLVTRGSDEAGITTITDRIRRKTVVRHVPAAGFVAQSPVVIDDRWALVEDVRSEGPTPAIRAYRYDLSTRRRTDFAELTTLPPISEPEIGAYDGRFAYTSTDRRKRSCLVLAELDTLRARTVACVEDPGFFADPVLSADAVTFSEITAPQTDKRCKRILTAPLSGGPATPIPAATKCNQWSGATLRGASVWSEVGASDPDQYESKAYVRPTAGAPAQPLGTIVTDTIIACGNWIHWVVRTVTEGTDSYHLRRWRPGLLRPQRIYSTPPDSAVSPPTCQDNTLLFEVAHLSGSQYTETLAAPAT